jgi:hypothetical protein
MSERRFPLGEDTRLKLLEGRIPKPPARKVLAIGAEIL